MALPTGEAHGIAGVAMQLDDALCGNARGLMQAIHILGDDMAQYPQIDQCGQRLMAAVGLDVPHGSAEFQMHLPALAARCLRTEEIIEENRLESRPQAIGAAKVRDARCRADAGAGKGYASPGLGQQGGQRSKGLFGGHGSTSWSRAG